ncbi:hypothetical protein SNEBB_004251 [Seison nebaliae]|nr:hypothetical protein SNEBB_004251 [Seison nebaliae]
MVNKCVAVVIAVCIPPLGVYLGEDSCNINVWINLCLTFLGYFPGIIHAICVIVCCPTKKRGPYGEVAHPPIMVVQNSPNQPGMYPQSQQPNQPGMYPQSQQPNQPGMYPQVIDRNIQDMPSANPHYPPNSQYGNVQQNYTQQQPYPNVQNYGHNQQYPNNANMPPPPSYEQSIDPNPRKHYPNLFNDKEKH